MYLDGQPIRTDTASGSIRVNSSESLTIANSIFNDIRSFHFNGAIDEVKIWSRSLTSAEILNEYQQYTPPGPPPPSSNIVGFWAFDGDATDSSGNGNDGTVSGATYVPGVNGSAVDFNSAGDYVRVDYDNTLDLTDAFTFSSWVYPRSYGWNTVYGRILDKGSDAYLFYLLNDSSQEAFATYLGQRYPSNNNIIELNKWQHISVTFNSSLSSNQIKFYLNGLPAGTATRSTDTNANTNPLYIGNRAAGGRTFDGLMDEVKIWNRDLTASEINNEFNQYTPPVFIDANFESDVEGFTYLDDLYFGTSNPAQESGQRESNTNCAAGQCLAVNLNLESACSNCGPYSGGWENSFTVINPTAVGVSFDYTLRLANPTEFGEYVNITSTDVEDGSTIVGGGIEHNNPGSDEYKSGTFYYSTGVLSPASYTFNAGCHLSQVSFTNENAECWVDNVLISSVSFNQWGALSDTFNTGTGGQNRMRCMGGTAPSLSNMIIDSLHMNFSVGGSAAMAVYFGGFEGNPTGAIKQAEVIGQTVTPGWYTFDLEPNIVWPSDQVTWVCWKLSGATVIYYSNSNAEAGDFFTTHGRHNETNSNLNPNLPFVNALTLQFSNYWYPVYVTYYEQ
jgi:hypothetical protein